jgi:hypothetical protein
MLTRHPLIVLWILALALILLAIGTALAPGTAHSAIEALT